MADAADSKFSNQPHLPSYTTNRNFEIKISNQPVTFESNRNRPIRIRISNIRRSLVCLCKGIVWPIGAVVCLLTAPRVRLSVMVAVSLAKLPTCCQIVMRALVITTKPACKQLVPISSTVVRSLDQSEPRHIDYALTKAFTSVKRCCY